MATTLEQTKGKIKLTGFVKGIKNENAFKEGFTKSDKPFKTISFFVETSPINRVKVELFGMEREHVYAYSQKAKESKKINWANRSDNHGDFKVMGVNMFIEDGTDGKKLRQVQVEFDAIDYIHTNLTDGDVVRINGEIDFQEYQNQQGQVKESQKFIIKSITKIDEELNFGAEDFKEVSQFEQEIVVTETMVDEETKKLIINAKVIKYGGESVNATFTVDGEKYPKLANNMAKRLSFGDFIKVYGLIINSSIREEAPVEGSVDDGDDWGGDDEIKNDFETSYITNYVQELQVTSVDSASYEQKKYNEEDFVSEEEDAFNGDVKGSGGDDFSDEDEEEIEDLPFS
jgi:hypothetical protein